MYRRLRVSSPQAGSPEGTTPTATFQTTNRNLPDTDTAAIPGIDHTLRSGQDPSTTPARASSANAPHSIQAVTEALEILEDIDKMEQRQEVFDGRRKAAGKKLRRWARYQAFGGVVGAGHRRQVGGGVGHRWDYRDNRFPRWRWWYRGHYDWRCPQRVGNYSDQTRLPIHNPWNNALDRAHAAGSVLAHVLIQRHLGVRPIIIFYALIELAKQKAYGGRA
ncbi:hypothetical protein MKEN_00880700 [Mycena kentingensis (nom. inval.)]|nr:hypothetical protein MKEN_00880700 [Mycena kentingensis (nom. inval.)]